MTIINDVKIQLQSFEETFDYDNALISVGSLLSIDPENSELLKKKLILLMQLNKPIDADFIIELCLKKTSDHEVFYYLAKYCAALEEAGSALVALACSLSIKETKQSRDYLNSLLECFGCKKLHIHILTTSRVGHLSMESDAWLRQFTQNYDSSIMNVFITNGASCNTALYNLIKRYLFFVESSFFYELLLARGKILSDEFYKIMPYDLVSTRYIDDNENNMLKNTAEIYSKTNRVMDLDDDEIKQAKVHLADYGIDVTKKIICLHVRDSAYLEQTKFDFSYHDFRDVDINNYKKAIEYLISQDYLVVRIGTHSNQQLLIESNNYIELVSLRGEDDASLAELFLIRYCYFYMGINSGPMSIAFQFDTPSLIVNCAPFHHCQGGFNTRSILKKVKKTDGLLNYIDLANGYTLNDSTDTKIVDCYNAKEMESNSIEYIENSPEDILKSVKEFENMVLNSNFSLTELQKGYLNQLPIETANYIGSTIPTNSYLNDNLELFNLT